MKINIRSIVTAAAVVFLASAVITGCNKKNSASSSVEKSIRLKLGHNLPEDHAVHIQLMSFANAVSEKTDGSVTIQIFPNATLGSETDMITQLQAGALDMAKVSASTIGNFKNEWNALSVPYVFNNKEHYFSVMDGEIAEELYALTENEGFVGLSWFDSGSRSFYTKNKAIRTPGDLRGLKIRTMDNQIAIEMMRCLGGSATVMTFSEVYTGLQQGVIDGAENNVTALRDHGEVAKYYNFDEHTRIPDILIISTKTLDKLSEAQRAIVKECAEEATQEYKQRWADFENEILDLAISRHGVTLVRDVDTQAFQQACQPIYEGLKSSDPEVYVFVEKIQNWK